MRRLVLVLVACLLAACATPPVGRPNLLDFVQPGTPRSELILKLGQPLASYEREHIMAWQIGKDEGGYFTGSAVSWPVMPRYQLVVVFDDSGKVLRHNLVEVHGPQ